MGLGFRVWTLGFRALLKVSGFSCRVHLEVLDLALAHDWRSMIAGVNHVIKASWGDYKYRVRTPVLSSYRVP